MFRAETFHEGQQLHCCQGSLFSSSEQPVPSSRRLRRLWNAHVAAAHDYPKTREFYTVRSSQSLVRYVNTVNASNL